MNGVGNLVFDNSMFIFIIYFFIVGMININSSMIYSLCRALNTTNHIIIGVIYIMAGLIGASFGFGSSIVIKYYQIR